MTHPLNKHAARHIYFDSLLIHPLIAANGQCKNKSPMVHLPGEGSAILLDFFTSKKKRPVTGAKFGVQILLQNPATNRCF